MKIKLLTAGMALASLVACGGGQNTSSDSSQGQAQSSSVSSAQSSSQMMSSSSSVSSSVMSSSSSSASSVMPPRTGKQVEALDRGLVAVLANGGVFLSWRISGLDPADVAFNLYRNGQLINGQPISSSSNYLDNQGNAQSRYRVAAVIDGQEQSEDGEVNVWQQNFTGIPLNPPQGGTTPDGVAFQYEANDASAADLDGDGDYEIILKWAPTNAKDNAHDGYTGSVYIDAYQMSGNRMWRINLGRNIRAGAHYTQFMVYDFDGDGRAEMAVQTADGTVDSQGKTIGNANADYRNSSGRVLSGPEFLTVFDGLTGAELQTIDYPNARGSVGSWGDNYGNRVDRFLAGVAYLDGQRPSMIFSRGYYEKAMISALDWRDGQLTKRWTFTADGNANQNYRGQGAHSLSIGDVDADGRDEIIFGAATIDDNGTGLYSTGLCHGDALHVTDIDPNRAGLEVFMVHESPGCYGNHGVEVHDARTGQILYSNDGGQVDVGRGVAIEVDPRYPGVEVFGSRGGTMTTDGQRFDYRPGSNFAIWWDGDLLREILDGSTIYKWDYNLARNNTILSGANFQAASNNGTKSTPSLSADLFGDWREEVVWRRNDNRELMIFTTTDLTQYKMPTLMHDPQYRVAIAWQNTAYNQPPHPSFFLGANMAPRPRLDLYEADGIQPGEEPVDGLRIQESTTGFCGVDGVLENTNGGFTGAAYANTDNALGNGVRWAINANGQQSVTVQFRYASIDARPAEIWLDGAQRGTLNFPATNAWTSWNVVETNLQIPAGQHQIELRASTDAGLGNVDYIQVLSDQVSAVSCP